MYLSLNAPIRSFETASRNSEVIHGGLYYLAGSLKSTLLRQRGASAFTSIAAIMESLMSKLASLS